VSRALLSTGDGTGHDPHARTRRSEGFTIWGGQENPMDSTPRSPADLSHGSLVIVSGHGDPGVGEALAARLGVPHSYPRLRQFSSSEWKIVNDRDRLYDHDVVVVTSGPGLDMVDMLMLGQLLGCCPRRVTVVLCYFPYSRSDKREDGMHHMTYTVLSLLQGACAGRLAKVMCFDLHAPQIICAGNPGFISELSLIPDLISAIVAYLGPRISSAILVSADAGGDKRIGKEFRRLFQTASGLWLPKAMILKERQADDSIRIMGVVGDEVAGRIPIIIDDECASGGTLAKDAEELKKLGALDTIAAVTHPVLSGSAVKVIGAAHIERLFVGDTIVLGEKGRALGDQLSVVSLVPRLAEAVRAWHEGHPVSKF